MTVNIDTRIKRLMEMADADFEAMKATPEWKAWDDADTAWRRARSDMDANIAWNNLSNAKNPLRKTKAYKAMQSAVEEIICALQDKYGVKI